MSRTPAPADDPLSPRKAPSQRRGRDRIEAILEAAHAVLRREGAEATTTTGIAQEAGVAVGSLYHYFPNKESIFLALYERKLEALRAYTAQAPFPLGPWREGLRSWVVDLKRKELEIGFDFALFDAIHHYARLADIGAAHAQAMALATARQIRAQGSTWSDAALYDVCLNAFFLNASSWLYWRAAGGYAPRAVERLADAVVAVLAPALDGAAEPEGPHLLPPRP